MIVGRAPNIAGPISADARELAGDPASIRAALAVAAKFARRYPKLADEFESAACLAIVEAARTFDPMRGVGFKHYLSRRLDGAMIDVIRSAGPQGFRRRLASPDVPKIVSLNAVVDRERGFETVDLAESSDLPVGWEAEYQDGLSDLAKGLTRQEGEVIRRLYGRAGQATMKRVANAIGLCESRVSQIHGEAIEELRRRMREGESHPTNREESEAMSTSINGSPRRREWIERLNENREKRGMKPVEELAPESASEPSKNETASSTAENRSEAAKPKSVYRGVYFVKGRKWLGQVYVDNRNVSLGYFGTEEEAAKAVDRALVEYELHRREPNFPDEMPTEWMERHHAEKARRRPAKTTGGKSRSYDEIATRPQSETAAPVLSGPIQSGPVAAMLDDVDTLASILDVCRGRSVRSIRLAIDWISTRLDEKEGVA